jgi:D-alanine-D-alanine ligase
MDEMTIQRSAPHDRVASDGPHAVAVLRGGPGSEREVSLQSGRCVADALRDGGLNVVTSDIGPEDLSVLDRPDVDVFFLALHGQFGEDGQLQQILEDRGLVYTGCGPEASRLAFDKIFSKQRFAAAGVSVAPTVPFAPETNRGDAEEQLKGLGERFVVKPIRQGSSVGVYIVDGPSETVERADAVCHEFGDCMIEPFIPGREITVGVVGRETLPIIEIRSQAVFYDYHAKYVDDQTEYLFDTIDNAETRAQIGRAALACFDALGCRDFARVDFILTEEAVTYALEINTIPGFTTHSLLPKAAARTGLSMSDLCVGIVRKAFAERGSTTNR